MYRIICLITAFTLLFSMSFVSFGASIPDEPEQFSQVVADSNAVFKFQQTPPPPTTETQPLTVFVSEKFDHFEDFWRKEDRKLAKEKKFADNQAEQAAISFISLTESVMTADEAATTAMAQAIASATNNTTVFTSMTVSAFASAQASSSASSTADMSVNCACSSATASSSASAEAEANAAAQAAATAFASAMSATDATSQALGLAQASADAAASATAAASALAVAHAQALATADAAAKAIASAQGSAIAVAEAYASAAIAIRKATAEVPFFFDYKATAVIYSRAEITLTLVKEAHVKVLATAEATARVKTQALVLTSAVSVAVAASSATAQASALTQATADASTNATATTLAIADVAAIVSSMATATCSSTGSTSELPQVGLSRTISQKMGPLLPDNGYHQFTPLVHLTTNRLYGNVNTPRKGPAVTSLDFIHTSALAGMPFQSLMLPQPSKFQVTPVPTPNLTVQAFLITITFDVRIAKASAEATATDSDFANDMAEHYSMSLQNLANTLEIGVDGTQATFENSISVASEMMLAADSMAQSAFTSAQATSSASSAAAVSVDCPCSSASASASSSADAIAVASSSSEATAFATALATAQATADAFASAQTSALALASSISAASAYADAQALGFAEASALAEASATAKARALVVVTTVEQARVVIRRQNGEPITDLEEVYRDANATIVLTTWSHVHVDAQAAADASAEADAHAFAVAEAFTDAAVQTEILNAAEATIDFWTDTSTDSEAWVSTNSDAMAFAQATSDAIANVAVAVGNLVIASCVDCCDECLVDDDCADQNPCTKNICDQANNQCSNPPECTAPTTCCPDNPNDDASDFTCCSAGDICTTCDNGPCCGNGICNDDGTCSTNGSGALPAPFAGTDASAQSISSQGGLASFDNGFVQVNVLPESVTGTVRLVYISQNASQQIDGFHVKRLFAMDAYTATCQPQKFTDFSKPVSIQVSYSPKQVDEVDEGQLGLYNFNSALNQWVALPSEVDTDSNTVTAEVEYFGLNGYLYALMLPVASVQPQSSNTPLYWTIGIGAVMMVIAVLLAGLRWQQKRIRSSSNLHARQ